MESRRYLEALKVQIIRESGFSIIEILAALTIFLVLATISLITWQSFAPVMILGNSVDGLAEALNLARTRAQMEQSQWMVILNYTATLYSANSGGTFHFPENSYVLVDDDGWTGSGPRHYDIHTMYGGSQQCFTKEYVPGTGNYTTDWRHNNMMEKTELFRGPIRLGRGTRFIPPPNPSYDEVRRIVFDYKYPHMFWQSHRTPSTGPIAPSARRMDTARIYIVDYMYKAHDSSKDNLRHLRLIRVTDKSVNVIGG